MHLNLVQHSFPHEFALPGLERVVKVGHIVSCFGAQCFARHLVSPTLAQIIGSVPFSRSMTGAINGVPVIGLLQRGLGDGLDNVGQESFTAGRHLGFYAGNLFSHAEANTIVRQRQTRLGRIWIRLRRVPKGSRSSPRAVKSVLNIEMCNSWVNLCFSK